MEFAGLDKLSLLDFDERVSCVLFTKGCNFRCPFCHNGNLVVDPDKDVIKFEDIISYIQKRIGILDAVVVTGGEPTLMPDLKGKIAQIKELGFEVKLDTNGTNPKILKELVNNNLVDYVAMDIKNSPSKYDVTVGTKADMSKILESIEFLKSGVVDYEFRTTLVEEFHDEVSIKEMGELVKGAKKLLLQQFKERDTCIKKGLHPVSEEKAQEFVKILTPYVSFVNLRGY